MNNVVMSEDIFIKDKKKIYYIKFKDYINLYYFKLNLQEIGLKKIDDVINYIDSLAICDYIVKLDEFNTYEI